MISGIGCILAAVSLVGVSGADLRARAFFDANNVHVGDPLVLTVDFIGEADFESLHPPALSKEVDRAEWKIDDASAKTETYRDARRLTYRVRPMREGLLRFPALSFTYDSVTAGGPAVVSTDEIPVHSKPGSQVALGELDAADGSLPMPDGLLIDLAASRWGSADALSPDEQFAWRKACANPSAAAFAPFGIPEARLNEAACEIVDGNWAKAMRVYSRLEWAIGQTPEIERGIVAALALKNSNPAQELPMWRRTFRGVLKFAWPGRLAAFAGAVAALAALLFALRRAVRALAAVAVAFAVFDASAQGLFDEMDRHFQRMQQEMDRQFEMMNTMMGVGGGGGGMSLTINGRPAPKVEIKASVRPDKTDIQVGEDFNFILALETPKSCTVSVSGFAPSQSAGFTITGNGEPMTDGRSTDTNCVVKRISIPARYDAPFKGRVVCSVSGMYDCRFNVDSGRGRSFSQRFSSNFATRTSPIWMEVKPLPGDEQPEGFAGVVASSVKVSQTADLYKVETNDVVSLTVRVDCTGYVPQGAIPGEMRRDDLGGGRTAILARRYFVADGAPATDAVSVPYYDTAKRKFAVATARGMAIAYTRGAEAEAERVVLDDTGAREGGRLVELRFAPKDSARAVAAVDASAAELRRTERTGAWLRVDDGRHAGWVRASELDR